MPSRTSPKGGLGRSASYTPQLTGALPTRIISGSLGSFSKRPHRRRRRAKEIGGAPRAPPFVHVYVLERDARGDLHDPRVTGQRRDGAERRRRGDVAVGKAEVRRVEQVEDVQTQRRAQPASHA